MTSAKQARGFALLNKEERAAISRKGSLSAHAQGRAHTFAKGEEAREAGRRGGLEAARRRAARLAIMNHHLFRDSIDKDESEPPLSSGALPE